ncbi:MAG: hypothetical protein H6577_07205 [Lewinellaceae bacterium]|nr:hypothetical protein [Saprospiraceae bacterium]MCB9337898.1 hypothetical protein [Lewinellaceae bacterium]
MTLPENSLIAEDKLTKYLLVSRARADKSKFLSIGGYTIEDWTALENDIRSLLQYEATEEEITEFGTLYSITGKLRNLQVSNGGKIKCTFYF